MFYHLSEQKGLKLLTPRIPECAVPIYEDTSIKRVCFSDSIDGCLSALQNSPEKYYVYVIDENINKKDIHYPTVEEVRDAKYTNEIWILKEVKVKCIGIIESENFDYQKQHNTGRGRITLFHYPYKWIKHFEY